MSKTSGKASLVIPGGLRGSICPGGLRGKHVIYRTKDNSKDYYFDIVRMRNGSYRIYIEYQPSYRSRNNSGHNTHRYYDENRCQHYICVKESLRPRTFKHALNWAKEWAENTEKYIKTGRRF